MISVVPTATGVRIKQADQGIDFFYLVFSLSKMLVQTKNKLWDPKSMGLLSSYLI